MNRDSRPSADRNRRTRHLALLTLALTIPLLLILHYSKEGGLRTPPPAWTPPSSGVEPVGPGQGFLRGAHWFGAGWAVNHWNTRLLARAEDDFAALREDGFNTVVLVVPWAGFMASPTATELDPERARRLQELLLRAREAGLNVVLRLGYAWDSAITGSGGWNVRLWLREDAYRGWLAYLEALGRLVEPHDHVRFGFISWEDLWAITGAAERGLQRRQVVAERSGYRDWLRSRHSLEEVAGRYDQHFADWSEVPVPWRRQPAFGLFLEYMDHAWIERFFLPAQAVFPRLSMEIRVDGDAVWSDEETVAYYHHHHASWKLPGAAWTTLYWAPSMNGLNQGETLSPETAAERLEATLRGIREVTGEQPLFIGQFLVEDHTPGFERNGRLDRDRIPDFLGRAAEVLRRQAHGYALWAWRDYRHNAIPSPDFSRVTGNWREQGSAAAAGSGFALAAGERLSRQFLPHEFHIAGGPGELEFCLEAEPDGDPAPDLRITAEPGAQVIDLDVSGAGDGCTTLRAGEKGLELALEALRPVELLGAHLSGFTQPIGMRDVNGSPKASAGDWRDLNAELAAYRAAPLGR